MALIAHRPANNNITSLHLIRSVIKRISSSSRCFIMAAEGGNFDRYIYRGEDGEVIPEHVIYVFEDATVVRRRAFFEHPNILEVICHDKVENIEGGAFWGCSSLRRVIMPGVKIAGDGVFNN